MSSVENGGHWKRVARRGNARASAGDQPGVGSARVSCLSFMLGRCVHVTKHLIACQKFPPLCACQLFDQVRTLVLCECTHADRSGGAPSLCPHAAEPRGSPAPQACGSAAKCVRCASWVLLCALSYGDTGGVGLDRYRSDYGGTGGVGLDRYRSDYGGTGGVGLDRYRSDYGGTGGVGLDRYRSDYGGTGGVGLDRYRSDYGGTGGVGLDRYRSDYGDTGGVGLDRYRSDYGDTGGVGLDRYRSDYGDTGGVELDRYRSHARAP
ncbi:uncharacterized PE-PGRS family protein PE_PGRS44 [Pan paniscus]|uniref:uncharacterized PE-PGRS family protein PE_PGRS44 n=1 Tax=Pan paniscus TaxID=9597 RepID=UPI0015604D8A|nr:uncharacterized PE-PGRS family protein PE_PGRS44 [Pan paniscus]